MKWNIIMHKVDLGTRWVDLPMYDSGMVGNGKTVLITAGMDGDEYTGMEAAKRLISYIKNKSIHGRIIICPLVNVPGNEIRHSRNPLDGLYPKYIYPGNPKGSATHRLIYWLYDHYIKHADLWLDLHGGATDEAIMPFVWSYQTNNTVCDNISENIIRHIMDTTIIYEQNPDWGKIHRLASENITYLIFEAGGSGKVREADINHHLDWITASLSSIGTIKVKSIKTNITGKNVWRNVTYFRAPYDCNWQPKKQPGETVGKNELLGYISSTRNVTRQILSSEDGIILWQKHDCTVPKSDTLIAIATN